MVRPGQRPARPAVQRGVKVLADLRRPSMGDKKPEILFGDTVRTKRQEI